jgi:tRNA pseudouridine32 synthase/23S rRNA pseudouridine746 synthase
LIDYRPPQSNTEIIHIDEDLLIVNKPAGLLTVPGRRPEHQDCLILRIQKSYPEALVVHRLDMSTSGLLIMARSSEVHRRLNRQFEQRQVKKNYLAVVTGQLEQLTGKIDLPLICDWPNRPRQIVDLAQGKPAVTWYRVLSYDNATETSRIELTPLTGRTHQLRVHLQALGHPILGDDLYAEKATLEKADRLLLHARSLEFVHPTSHEAVHFTKEAPF